MLQLVWCLDSSPWPCHVTTAQPSLVASGTASYLWNYSPRLEVYPWRCFSLPARAMHSSGQHPWSSQTTVCVNWLHANVCCTMELWWQWAGSVEQSASNTARQYRVTTHIQVATEKIAICSMVNTIRRCCSVFASLLQPTLAPLYKTLDLLTYIQFFIYGHVCKQIVSPIVCSTLSVTEQSSFSSHQTVFLMTAYPHSSTAVT